MPRRMLSCFVCAIALLLAAQSAPAAVRLPAVFGDHMVLQRDLPAAVWGWADPGEKVTVAIGEQEASTTADSNGRWLLKLAPMKAGGPLTMTIRGINTLTIEDVLVGEVWLCSGQSNMEMHVIEAGNRREEIPAAEHPHLRMFTVTRNPRVEPQDDCQGEWQVCMPQSVGQFSATAYYFGRDLEKALDVPVGLLHSSYGGTPIEAWTSMPALKADPAAEPALKDFDDAVKAWSPEEAAATNARVLESWKNLLDKYQATGHNTPAVPNKTVHPDLNQRSPARLFNGMIHPIIPYTIRGAIWYQGEANSQRWQHYKQQLQTMIVDWRKRWGQGDFPFIYVQLPGFQKPQQQPVEPNGWQWIREQFLQALDTIPQTGMAVAIDVGEADDIHPLNKQAVGNRLAQWALSQVYGRDIPPCGPLYAGIEKRDGKLIVRFKHAEGGLLCKGDALEGFAIAGADRKFVWATAKIVHEADGNVVEVSNEAIADPVAVRYAWAMNPKANLYNEAGLPASPFRSDDWPR